MIWINDFHNSASSATVNVPVYFVSVIDFLVSSPRHCSWWYRVFFSFQIFSNSWSYSCVGRDIFFNNTVRATGGGPIPTNTNVGNQERLDKDRSYENSVVNKNVGNQEMLDKDYMRTHM